MPSRSELPVLIQDELERRSAAAARKIEVEAAKSITKETIETLRRITQGRRLYGHKYGDTSYLALVVRGKTEEDNIPVEITPSQYDRQRPPLSFLLKVGDREIPINMGADIDAPTAQRYLEFAQFIESGTPDQVYIYNPLLEGTELEESRALEMAL